MNQLPRKKILHLKQSCHLNIKLNILRKAKEEGYFIKCVFVLTVDPQINIARIESRVAAGGHNVVGKNIRALSSSYPHFESPTY